MTAAAVVDAPFPPETAVADTVAQRCQAHHKTCGSKEFERTDSQWLRCRECGDPV